jgi:hypothetical protein
MVPFPCCIYASFFYNSTPGHVLPLPGPRRSIAVNRFLGVVLVRLVWDGHVCAFRHVVAPQTT